LLLKGSKRNLKNRDGQTARDIVRDGEMKNELYSILKEQNYCS